MSGLVVPIVPCGAFLSVLLSAFGGMACADFELSVSDGLCITSSGEFMLFFGMDFVAVISYCGASFTWGETRLSAIDVRRG